MYCAALQDACCRPAALHVRFFLFTTASPRAGASSPRSVVAEFPPLTFYTTPGPALITDITRCFPSSLRMRPVLRRHLWLTQRWRPVWSAGPPAPYSLASLVFGRQSCVLAAVVALNSSRIHLCQTAAAVVAPALLLRHHMHGHARAPPVQRATVTTTASTNAVHFWNLLHDFFAAGAAPMRWLLEVTGWRFQSRPPVPALGPGATQWCLDALRELLSGLGALRPSLFQVVWLWFSMQGLLRWQSPTCVNLQLD